MKEMVKSNIYSKINKETRRNKMMPVKKASNRKITPRRIRKITSRKIRKVAKGEVIQKKINRDIKKIISEKFNKNVPKKIEVKTQKNIPERKVIPQKKVVEKKIVSRKIPEKKIVPKVSKERIKINVKLLVSSYLLVSLIAILGMFFTQSNVNTLWYNAIKPNFAPPSFVFGIVWSVLFFLIALSLYLCLNKKNGNKLILLLFSINLFLNAFWSFLFFYMQNPMFAFFDLIALWISIILMIFFAYKTDKLAAYLLIPYFFWISFAGALNYISAFMVTLV